MGVKIDVVADYIYDSSDNGVLDQWVKIHPNALRTNAVRDMVRKVIARSAGLGKIETLRIFGHGSPGAQWVGGGFGGEPDAVQRPAQAIHVSGAVLQHENVLTPLQGKFDPNGIVELHGCGVGMGVAGKALCTALASFWGVIVRAGTDLQYADADNIFESGYIQADPTGRVIQFTQGSLKYVVIARRRPVIELPPINLGRPPPAPANNYLPDYPITKSGVMLSNVSKEIYKTFELWPLIYDDNKALLPNGPNKVPLNIRLKMRKPDKFTPAEIAHAKKHWQNWQTYK